MNGDLERFRRAWLYFNLSYLPSFTFARNKGTLFGKGFFIVHVKVNLFRRGIVVVLKDYLFSRFHRLLSKPEIFQRIIC